MCWGVRGGMGKCIGRCSGGVKSFGGGEGDVGEGVGKGEGMAKCVGVWGKCGGNCARGVGCVWGFKEVLR